MGSDSDGKDYESPATLLAVAIAHSPNTIDTLLLLLLLLLLLVFVEGEDSRRLRHVVVDARDRLEREGRRPTLLARSAHGVFSPAPPTKPHLCVR